MRVRAVITDVWTKYWRNRLATSRRKCDTRSRRRLSLSVCLENAVQGRKCDGKDMERCELHRLAAVPKWLAFDVSSVVRFMAACTWYHCRPLMAGYAILHVERLIASTNILGCRYRGMHGGVVSSLLPACFPNSEPSGRLGLRVCIIWARWEEGVAQSPPWRWDARRVPDSYCIPDQSCSRYIPIAVISLYYLSQ